MRARSILVAGIVMLLSADRLPAPITEESAPTPAPTYDYRGFVLQHLQKCINRDILGIVNDYAETVDYYENGVVGHSFIAQDRQKFANFWPTLSIQLTSPINYDESNTPRITVTFSYNFETRNGRKTSRGSAENVWTLLQTGNALKIVAEKQTVTNRARK